MKLALEASAAVVVHDVCVDAVADRERPPVGVDGGRDEDDAGRGIRRSNVADRVEIETALGVGADEDDVGMRQRRGPDRVAHGLGPPGDAHLRVVVDDRADLLPPPGIGLDDEDPDAGTVGCLRTGDGPPSRLETVAQDSTPTATTLVGNDAAMHDDLWSVLGPLEAEVDRYELEAQELATPGFVRQSTTVVLEGAGADGRGEDVSYSPDDQAAHRRLAPLPLSGRRTLAEWSALLDAQDLFPEETKQHAARDYRRWAYESALLDLALNQAGATLGQAVGRPYAPLRFVVSSNLDAALWLELYPGVEMKVDAGAEWGRADFERVAAAGIVRVVDIKGQYGADYPQGERDEAGLVALAAEILPDAIIEDPSTEPDVLPAIAAAADRISFDAPVHAVADLAGLPPIRHLNVKPSRFGTLERLCACLDHCRQEGIAMYAGGQFELGVGRAQIQAIASLFYPNGPNDCAPGGYNAPEPTPGLPVSPLGESAWRGMTAF